MSGPNTNLTFNKTSPYTLHTQCGPNDPGADVTIIAYDVESVEWETYMTNEPIVPPLTDPNDPNSPIDPNGTYIIFPGKKTYDDDSEDRNKVRAVATLTEALENKIVYYKWFDNNHWDDD